VDDAEALRVAEAPLEVVEQRPGEVAAEIRPLSDGIVGRAQVHLVVRDTQRIVDAAVDRLRRIVEGCAVLGDVERQPSISLRHPEQHAGERLGKDLPPRLGDGVLRLADAARAYGERARVVAADVARVVVDADEVDRLPDERHVLRRPIRPRHAEDLAQFGGIAAEEDGIEILPVHVGIGPLRRLTVGGAVRCRILRLEVHDDADAILPLGAVRLHGGAVRAHEVVRRDRRLEQVAVAGREGPVQVAAIGDHPGLVERAPHRHAVAEGAIAHARVVGEPVGDVAIEPAATIVERFGEIPVIERRRRLDVALQQRIDQPRVEVDALLVDATRALGKDAAPRDAEAVGVEAELGHQRDVLRVPPVVIARDVARVAIGREAGAVREALPDARARAVGERRTFDLVCGGGGSPEEAVGKSDRLGHCDGFVMRGSPGSKARCGCGASAARRATVTVTRRRPAWPA
jgi:hypothetical protein